MTTVQADSVRDLARRQATASAGIAQANGYAPPRLSIGGLLREPIARKLSALVVLACATIVTVGSIGMYGLRLLSTSLTEVADVSVNRLNLASEVQQDVLSLLRAERNMILSDDPVEIEKIFVDLTSRVAELRARLSGLRGLTSGGASAPVDDLEAAVVQWLEVDRRVVELSRTDADETAFDLATGEGRRVADRTIGLARSIADNALREIDNDQLTTAEAYDAARSSMLITMLLGLALAGTVGAMSVVDIGNAALRRQVVADELRAKNDSLDRKSSDLVRVNVELEQFAYVASHDLRAPLRAIDNLAAWIAEDLGSTLQGETESNMKLMRGRVHRLERLLDDVLKFSRAGRVAEDVQDVELGTLLHEVVDLIGVPQGFAVRWAESSPTLRTARTALEQVLANLIGNAIKHHDRETGTVEITIRDDGLSYEITVSDDGPGIPTQFHERVFQMFQSLKPRDEVEGSGMGLAIVKKLIESQRGTIRIESQDGARGTSFRFSWPKVWHNRTQNDD